MGINPFQPSLFRRRTATFNAKAPRQEPRRLAMVLKRRSVGLLDRREFPVGATRPDERPYLGGFRRLITAGNHLAADAVERLVDQREAQRDGCKVAVAFAPCFRKITLQQLDVA